MKLYKVTMGGGTFRADYFVLADNETQASEHIVQKYEEWDYTSRAYAAKIEIVAVDGQYGKPSVLLNALEDKK